MTAKQKEAIDKMNNDFFNAHRCNKLNVKYDKVTFSKTDIKSIKASAAFIAELVKQQVTFDIIDEISTVTVVITGGF